MSSSNFLWRMYAPSFFEEGAVYYYSSNVYITYSPTGKYVLFLYIMYILYYHNYTNYYYYLQI